MSPTGVFKEFFLKVNHSDVLSFITARKRSCGKVMFLHLSMILFTGGSLSRGSLSRGGLCLEGLCLKGLCPGGSLCLGVPVQGGGFCSGGVCPGVGEVFVGGVSVRGSLSGRPTLTPSYSNMRVVRILLECIHVIFCLTLSQQQKHKVKPPC